MSSPRKTFLPNAVGISTHFPAALEHVQASTNMEDHDSLTPETMYVLKPCERLVVGKYVPDAACKDPSNPKYTPRTNEENVESEHSCDEDGESQWSAAAARERVTYSIVSASTPQMVGSLYFPIFYGPPNAKDKQDSRGLPLEINQALHPSDFNPKNIFKVSVIGINLNKLCLYKIGPGAVAFRVVINALEAGGMKYTPSNRHFNLLWAKRATPHILAKLSPFQKINHFPGTWGIGRKDMLAMNVARMRRQFGSQIFNIVPPSFILPRDMEDVEGDYEQAMSLSGKPPTYIVKPCASSCGRGIKLYRGVPPAPKADRKVVCQRYIGNPFLVEQRKFDLRMYCVVSGFDPLRIFLFDEGLVRFAAEKYPGPDKGLDNSYMHLTNYSISKTAELSRKYSGKDMDTDGPVDIKWCITDFRQWLKRTYGEDKGTEMWGAVLRNVYDIVIKAFISIEAEVVQRIRAECSDPSGRGCFELYGLDIMIDEQLHAYLIEVNIMPSLATGSTLDKAVKSRMLSHMLNLIRVYPYDRSKEIGSPKSRAPASSSGTERYYYVDSSLKGCVRGPAERTNIPLLTKFHDPANKDSMLSTQEIVMLKESEEELNCCGGFTRIFPRPGTAQTYFPLFTAGVLRSNYLLASLSELRERVVK